LTTDNGRYEVEKMRSCSNAIYGPRIKGTYQCLLQTLARRRFIPIGDGSNRRTLIYDKDVARAAVSAATHPAAAGKVFNVSDVNFTH
jgi:UDP-glucose 4-epimerase